MSLLPQLLQNKSYNELQWIYFNATRTIPWSIPNSYFIPPLAMSEADANRIADIAASLTDYKQKAWVEFIVGNRNIANDAHWNTYLQELDRLSSKELAAIYDKYL
jgi:hypothetical protein